MSKLKEIDNKAAEKGSGIETFWQFVKFIFVSLIAMIVQFALLNILRVVLQNFTELYAQSFSWWVYKYTVEDGGLGYFIAFNVSNVVAQIVAFFVNREKTFNANNNIPVTLTVYIVFTVALLMFSAWLSPALYGFLLGKGVSDALSTNIATMACSCVQFFLYFPVDKLLMKNKDKDKNKKEAKEGKTV